MASLSTCHLELVVWDGYLVTNGNVNAYTQNMHRNMDGNYKMDIDILGFIIRRLTMWFNNT